MVKLVWYNNNDYPKEERDEIHSLIEKTGLRYNVIPTSGPIGLYMAGGKYPRSEFGFHGVKRRLNSLLEKIANESTEQD